MILSDHGRKWGLLGLLGHAVALIGLLLLIVSIHNFFEFAGRAPYVAVDDSVMNVSVSLSELGIYGFRASPIQPPGAIALRHENFTNYGPWYFYLGAALSWLFEPSLVLMRSLHLFGITAIGVLGFFAFRGVSRIAAGILFITLFAIFWRAHWPMVRPDIMVSVLATGAVFAASTLGRGGSGRWFLAGFLTAAASTQHLIAWALVPALAVIWGIGQAFRAREGVFDRRQMLLSAAMAFLGGLAATMIYLYAQGFRIGVIIDHVTGYRAQTSGNTPVPYLDLLTRHAAAFWRPLPWWIQLVVAGGALSWGVAFVHAWRRGESGRATLGILIPAPVFLVAYLLSLGFYNNFHPGYYILSQVMCLWSASAGYAGILREIEAWKPRAAVVLAFAGLAAVIFVGSKLTYIGLTNPPARQVAERNVPFETYLHEVLSPVPDRGVVWGDVQLGLYSGVRIDVLQYTEGWFMAKLHAPGERDAVAPDFLALMGGMTSLFVYPALAKKGGTAHQMATLFPDQEYRLGFLVFAPPYRQTALYYRVYKGSPPDTNDLPTIAANNGTAGQWKRNLAKPLDIAFDDAGTMQVRIVKRKRTSTASHAMKSVGPVPAGTYLVSASLSGTSTDKTGVLLASSKRNVELRHGAFGFVAAPLGAYMPGEKTAHLIVKHAAGPLFLGLLDHSTGARIVDVKIRPIIGFPTGHAEKVFARLPPLDQWKLSAYATRVSRLSSNLIEVLGGATPGKYQFYSPQINVPRNTDFVLNLEVIQVRGGIHVGILNETDSGWVKPTQNPKPRTAFNTGESAKIRIMISNANPDQPREPVVFRVREGGGLLRPMKGFSSEGYLDRLVECLRRKIETERKAKSTGSASGRNVRCKNSMKPTR